MRAAIRTLSVYNYGDRLTAGRTYISSISRLTQYNCNINQNTSVGCIRRRTTDTNNCQFYSLNNNINVWKYSYRSNQIRRFAIETNNTKPNPTNDIENSTGTSYDESTDTSDEEQQLTINTKKKKTNVPKEYIDAIKSQVDDMESSSSSSHTIKPQRTQQLKKTQDDFADYLQGNELMLDGDTGLFVKRQNFGKNELNRKLKAYESSSSKHSTTKTSATKDEKSKHSAITQSATKNEKIDTESSSTMQPTDSNIIPPPPSQHPVYTYKFSPTDATLSDPKSHLDRRRAIEKKLQDTQSESRATTMKNVQRALGGNFIIAAAKSAAALSSGSSAMLSEFVHSVVDCGNQALLLVGLNSSQYAPDRSHPYGYGKAIYFWALVSALGTFFLGAGVSMTHAVESLMHPSMTSEVPNEVWGVLLMSFLVDGYVFSKTVQGIRGSMSIEGNKDMSFWKYATTKVRDPATLAVLLEDGAACLGVVLAIGGIGMTQYTMNPVFDGMAGVCISGLLAAMGMALANVNHRFLIGQGLDKATREDIEKIILSRRSIDNVYSVQSQWTGPDTFSYKAEVDFDGTFLAAKLLPRYQSEFFDARDSLDKDLRVLLSWYAEDVMRAVEREVRHIEEEIRMKYPAAQYIELEPMSKDADRYAIDDGMKAQLRRVEIDVLNRYLKSLYKIKESGPDTGKDN